jgi:hypothetical protein
MAFGSMNLFSTIGHLFMTVEEFETNNSSTGLLAWGRNGTVFAAGRGVPVYILADWMWVVCYMMCPSMWEEVSVLLRSRTALNWTGFQVLRTCYLNSVKNTISPKIKTYFLLILSI